MRAKNNYALRYACCYGHTSIVQILCQFLTVDDMRAHNNEAFRTACINGHCETVELLSRFLTAYEMRAIFDCG